MKQKEEATICNEHTKKGKTICNNGCERERMKSNFELNNASNDVLHDSGSSGAITFHQSIPSSSLFICFFFFYF